MSLEIVGSRGAEGMTTGDRGDSSRGGMEHGCRGEEKEKRRRKKRKSVL
jgi:hypothetical protein